MEQDGTPRDENDENRPPEENFDEKVDCSCLPLRPFFKHQWLDVRDKVDKWLEAQVIDVDGDNIWIHYKGWKDKFDEKLDVSEGSEDLKRIAAPLIEFHEHPPRADAQIDLRQGAEVDVHDTSEKWCKGQITDIAKERPNRYQVKVHYEGWDADYDEWINLDSYRLAPRHLHTSPPVRRRPSLNRQNSEYKPPSDEETRFRDEMKRLKGWTIRDMDGDGNCLFRSIAFQVYGDSKHHGLVREKCMDYIEAERSFFRNYIDGDLKSYIVRMRQSGEWGDNVEIQAMSEMYSRRVEIYAYRTEPMKTYQRHLGGTNPMRISYHCQSHYNTIDYPELKQVWLTSEPGVFEDRVIAASRSRVRIRPDTRTQDSELKLALEVSRQEFKRGDNLFDNHIQEAIEESKKTAVDPYEIAVLNSLGVNTDPKSMDEQMARALQASMTETKNTELQQALALSMEDPELQKVLELSKQELKEANSAPSKNDSGTAPMAVEEPKNRTSDKNDLKAVPSLETKMVEASSSSTPKWLEDLMREMNLPRDKALRAYNRFQTDKNVSPEIMKHNIIMYCLNS